MTSPARRTALCCRQKPWKLERNRGEISKRVEQETSDIIDPGQRTDEDCARCSRGWWLSDSGSAPADKLSRNNGHTPPKEEGGHRIHTKKRRERESERVRESRQRWRWRGSTRTTLVVRAGCRELATGYGHRMCHGVVAALILHPRTHVSRETYSWWDSRFTVTVRCARWAAGTRRLRWCIRGWLDATKCGSRAYFMCYNRWLCRAEAHGSGWCRGLSPNRETDAGTGQNGCPKLDQLRLRNTEKLFANLITKTNRCLTKMFME